MPFFIPVEYYDTRIQFNDNVSWLRGAHSIKAGVEFNRVNSVQTFLGFANGRYIFDSTDGFLRRLVARTSTATAPTTHVLLYLQQAGVGDISVEEAGTQSIPQNEPGVFLQDSWQATPNLNVQYGLRWEAQIQPDPITDPDEVFYAPFIGTTVRRPGVPVGRQDSVRLRSMWQPRFGISWNPGGDGTQGAARERGHLLRTHPGPVARVVALDERQPRPDDLPQQRASNFDGCLPGLSEQAPGQLRRRAVSIRTCSCSTRTSRIPARRRRQRLVGAGAHPGLRVPREVQLRQGRAHHALHQRQRSAALDGEPAGLLVRLRTVQQRPRAGRHERHRRAHRRRARRRRASITA